MTVDVASVDKRMLDPARGPQQHQLKKVSYPLCLDNLENIFIFVN